MPFTSPDGSPSPTNNDWSPRSASGPPAPCRFGPPRCPAATYELDDASNYQPDTALVNYYSEGARLGMHQDKDEIINEPVVSLSIGDSCKFRFGNVENRGRPYSDITLCSGDAFVFGHESRFAYHAVPKTYPGTAPSDCDLEHGRINITMRMTGLQD